MCLKSNQYLILTIKFEKQKLAILVLLWQCLCIFFLLYQKKMCLLHCSVCGRVWSLHKLFFQPAKSTLHVLYCSGLKNKWRIVDEVWQYRWYIVWCLYSERRQVTLKTNLFFPVLTFTVYDCIWIAWYPQTYPQPNPSIPWSECKVKFGQDRQWWQGKARLCLTLTSTYDISWPSFYSGYYSKLQWPCCCCCFYCCTW